MFIDLPESFECVCVCVYLYLYSQSHSDQRCLSVCLYCAPLLLAFRIWAGDVIFFVCLAVFVIGRLLPLC